VSTAKKTIKKKQIEVLSWPDAGTTVPIAIFSPLLLFRIECDIF